MIGASQYVGAKVLLVGMRIPPNYGADYADGFEQVYRDLAAHFDVALLPFLLEPIAADRGNFQDDNLHPVAGAQPALRDHLWEALRSEERRVGNEWVSTCRSRLSSSD